MVPPPGAEGFPHLAGDLTVYCEKCEHHCVPYPSAKDKPWSHICLKHRRVDGYGYVVENYTWEPPYRRCDAMNPDGMCPLWEEKKEEK